MVFTSLNFLIFFPLVAALYWISPARFRWIILLIASYFFYLNVKPVFALLMAGVTLTTYLFSILIAKTVNESRKKSYLLSGILLILLPLFFFKYYSNINSGIISLMESIHMRWPLPEIKLILPVGISFYTFVAVGYILDIYNEEIKPEKNPGILALFISFFPLILSGPIERARNMLPQFKAHRKIDSSYIIAGLKLMLWGYFMKLVVADRIGIYVDAVYDFIPQHNGSSLLLASILYPFQMYADLGGYSLIAIGVSKTMGINVMQNFKRPFFASSMSEFWRRWHISLITWLTDYIYTPLSFALRDLKIWGIVTALMITFLISGIWHGATLTFLVWGLMQGAFLSIEAITNKRKAQFEKKNKLAAKRWYFALGMLITFILFMGSQIFSRAADLNDALQVYSRIFTDPFHLPYKDGDTMLYSVIGLCILFTKEFTEEFFPSRFLLFENRRIGVRWASYYFIIFLILFLGVFGQEKFIYFQF